MIAARAGMIPDRTQGGIMNKTIAGAILSAGTLAIFAGPALAEHCYNPNKPAGAGAQVILDENFEVGPDSVQTKGLQNRIDKGLVDTEEGEGYHGIVGFDLDGDGEADFSTWQVTPTGSIPHQAIFNGSPDHGIIQIPLG